MARTATTLAQTRMETWTSDETEAHLKMEIERGWKGWARWNVTDYSDDMVSKKQTGVTFRIDLRLGKGNKDGWDTGTGVYGNQGRVSPGCVYWTHLELLSGALVKAGYWHGSLTWGFFRRTESWNGLRCGNHPRVWAC